ncbi:MAG: polyprenol monophosphomannose synthase [Candidatus Hydrogenedentes bacterium]|nr:polyprenol monophosphomannose synthase [Candidatus Hydrogenedentota bacterium]
MMVIVVIPTYNERDNLDPILDAVLKALPEAHVLVVDDSSPDGTGQLADAWAERVPERVSVLHRLEKCGLGAAYVAAYGHVLKRWPEVQFVFQMDADFSHDPAHVRLMLEAAQEAGLVIGSRYAAGGRVENWPLPRLLLSRMGTWYARLATGLPVADCTAGFKCFRADALRAIDLAGIRSNGYCFQIEMTYRAWQAGFNVVEVPIVFRERTHGESKLDWLIAFEAIRVVTRLGIRRLLGREPRAMQDDKARGGASQKGQDR